MSSVEQSSVQLIDSYECSVKSLLRSFFGKLEYEGDYQIYTGQAKYLRDLAIGVKTIDDFTNPKVNPLIDILNATIAILQVTPGDCIERELAVLKAHLKEYEQINPWLVQGINFQ